MEATVALGVALHGVEDLITVFIKETTVCLEFLLTLREVVVIDEVVTGIIRRVNVDHLDLAEIVLAENF